MSNAANVLLQSDDAQIDALTRDLCRDVLRYFTDRSTEVATVDELERFVRERDERDEDDSRIAIRLHHSALPRLEDAGVAEYDPRSNTVRYRIDPSVEEWMRVIDERGEA